MNYKGVEITVRKSGKFQLTSPVNGTTRIFPTLEMAKAYVDRAEDLDFRARMMND